MRTKVTRISELPKPVNSLMCVNTGKTKMKDDNKLEITSEDIETIYNKYNGLNVPLVKEAYRQTELKVQDEQVRKERIDRRAFTLLTVHLTLIGLIVGLISSTEVLPIFLILISVTGLILIAGTFCLFQSLRSRKYAPLGTYPHSWLIEGYLKNNKEESSNNQMLALALARLLHNQEVNIQVGDRASSIRLKWLNWALRTSQLSMIPIALCLIAKITQLASSLCS